MDSTTATCDDALRDGRNAALGGLCIGFDAGGLGWECALSLKREWRHYFLAWSNSPRIFFSSLFSSDSFF